MRAFYGDRFSPNMTRTPEGFLICHNVPIARTGTQDYLPRELGLDGDGMVHVNRHEEDVFSPAALASFEGKPVTDDHPPVEVSPSNYGAYMRGVTQNVRRQGNYIVADLIIHDAKLISEIEAGKREISCGYECNYVEDEGGGYKQTDIVGNHVAVVTSGRAGPTVKIKDQKPERRRSMGKKSILQKMFASFIKDADPEEVQEAAKAVEDASCKDEEEEKVEVKEECKDEDTTEVKELARTVDALAKTVDALAGIVSLQNRGKVKTTLDELEEELKAETKDEAEEEAEAEEKQTEDEDAEESVTVAPEDIQDEDKTDEQKPAQDRAVALAAIRAVKPIIAQLPVKQRKAANDAMGKAIRDALGTKSTQPLPGGYGALMKRNRTVDARKAEADLKAFGEACRKRNPHYKKEEK